VNLSAHRRIERYERALEQCQRRLEISDLDIDPVKCYAGRSAGIRMGQRITPSQNGACLLLNKRSFQSFVENELTPRKTGTYRKLA
jgi:hypothetical protein